VGGDFGSEPSIGDPAKAATQFLDLKLDLGIAAAPAKGAP
jgi:hypothetical protein